MLEISNIKGFIAKRSVLKEHITNHAKLFRSSKYKTCWPVQDKHHAVNYVFKHLLNITRDSALNNKPKIKSSINIPIRKNFSSFGVRTEDFRAKEEEHTEESRVIEIQCSNARK